MFDYGFEFPQPTSRAASEQVVRFLPACDAQGMRKRVYDNRATHVRFGDDSPDFWTICGDAYTEARGSPAAPSDSQQESSIAFDRDAGYGTHTRVKAKRLTEVRCSTI
jgi:hypothetical protein